ncbi:MAG: DUF1876 domain-containing protein [Micromonosporaceae bacterium]
MTVAKRWNVDIFIDEHDEERRTYAEARLHTGDRPQLCGTGWAHRHPRDREVPEIGDELAAARALSELSHRLLSAAVEDIEEVNADRVRLAG